MELTVRRLSKAHAVLTGEVGAGRRVCACVAQAGGRREPDRARAATGSTVTLMGVGVVFDVVAVGRRHEATRISGVFAGGSLAIALACHTALTIAESLQYPILCSPAKDGPPKARAVVTELAQAGPAARSCDENGCRR